jgi:hypothetical protein
MASILFDIHENCSQVSSCYMRIDGHVGADRPIFATSLRTQLKDYASFEFFINLLWNDMASGNEGNRTE